MISDLRPADPVSVGPYSLLGRLGAGGMGQVYLAKSPGGHLVTVKVIRPELADERGFRTRFGLEVAAARKVSGMFTAAVMDADPDAERPWMATAYVPGPSLGDAVDEEGPLPVKSVLALAAGLAEALQAIHAVGMVHRDLKPSNILLASDGPRVIDFGISRARERSRLTTTGVVMGSPGFLSPEQAMGRAVGPPSDLFSLGAVLAFAVTGDSPFGSGPTPALLYRTVNQSAELSAVPARLRPLIEHCLVKDPAGRPTPAELLTQLSPDVGVIIGEWLPKAITDTLGRYVPNIPQTSPDLQTVVPSEPSPAPVPTASDSALIDTAPSAAVLAAQVPSVPVIIEPTPDLAAAWPTGPALGFSAAARTVQGGAGRQIPLRERNRRFGRWHFGAAKTVIAAAVVVSAAGTALAVWLTQPTAPRVTRPVVSGIAPARGTAAGGTIVVITGTGLADATAVKFGRAAGTITADSSTQITAISPAGTGTVNITVTTAAGTSAATADRFTYAAQAPIVTGVSPSHGSTAGAITVTITGTGLADATAVKFGGVPGTITRDSGTQITAISPAGTGTVNITVTAPAGTSPATTADRFTYRTPAPTVTAVSPSQGSTVGGTRVTITGTNLSGATEVSFGGARGTITRDSGTQIIVTSPAGSGTVDIKVTTPVGTSTVTSADRFTYVVPAPQLVTVPDTDGLTVNEATQILEADGFQVKVEMFGISGNTVFDYTPVGEAPPGSTITLAVGATGGF